MVLYSQYYWGYVYVRRTKIGRSETEQNHVAKLSAWNECLTLVVKVHVERRRMAGTRRLVDLVGGLLLLAGSVSLFNLDTSSPVIHQRPDQSCDQEYTHTRFNLL